MHGYCKISHPEWNEGSKIKKVFFFRPFVISRNASANGTDKFVATIISSRDAT